MIAVFVVCLKTLSDTSPVGSQLEQRYQDNGIGWSLGVQIELPLVIMSWVGLNCIISC